MKFSERIGVVPVNATIQVHGMSTELRNSLWNVLDQHVWSYPNFLYQGVGHRSSTGHIKAFSAKLWADFFKLPMDTRAYGGSEILRSIRTWYFKASWHEVYDFIEWVFEYEESDKLIASVNAVLERELAGYRCINKQLVPVTDEMELEAVDRALTEGPFKGVQEHIRQALDHLARRDSPDFRNSIKESICAVESMVRELTGKETASLGDALAELEKKHGLHPALKRGFSAIYGYSSDEGGIRHAMSDVPDIDVSDAKFMLISCSTFINYLKSKFTIST